MNEKPEGSLSFHRFIRQHPLTAFSEYTQIQVSTLQRLATRIELGLDAAMAEGRVDAVAFNNCYGLLWLWVLAAYEVTRTMTQARDCFSEELAEQLAALKSKVSLLRMPFAKQEMPGKKKPIEAEASIYGIDIDSCDISFRIKDTVVSARNVITDFRAIVENIKPGDILHDHRWSYT